VDGVWGVVELEAVDGVGDEDGKVVGVLVGVGVEIGDEELIGVDGGVELCELVEEEELVLCELDGDVGVLVDDEEL
jgi:hypothetical protein